MKNFGLFVLFVSLSVLSFGQSTVVRDTLTDEQEDVEIRYTVNAVLADVEEIEIHQYAIESTDTLSIFVGTYNLDVDDASEFMEFTYDEENNQLVFGIGAFNPALFSAEITVKKKDGTEEEFIIND